MDADEQRAFLDPNLADDVQSNLYDAWRRSPDVDASDVGAAVRRFDALDADDSTRFRSILADPDLRSSWVRAVGESGIDTSQIRIALQRVDQIGDQHRIRRFLSARVANDQFVTRKLDEGVDAPVRPHKRNSIVIEYETSDTQTLYRLWDDTDPRSNMRGEWTTTGRVINDADGFDELNDVLASPEGIEYNRIARVDVEEGTTVRMSTAGRNWGQNGGAVQTLLRDRVPSSNWDPLDGLSDVNP